MNNALNINHSVKSDFFHKEINVSDLARKYRDKIGRYNGVVVVFDGEVNGWMNELRDPDGWVPGCVAIDSQERCFISVGGNDYDGSKEWRAIK